MVWSESNNSTFAEWFGHLDIKFYWFITEIQVQVQNQSLLVCKLRSSC